MASLLATASQRQQEPAVVNQTDTAARNVGDEEVVHDVLTQPKAGSINNDIFEKVFGGCFLHCTFTDNFINYESLYIKGSETN